MSLVKVISTGRSPHFPKGEAAELSAESAKVLVDKGVAEYAEKSEPAHTPKADVTHKPKRKK